MTRSTRTFAAVVLTLLTLTLALTGTANAAPYTKQFRGVGDSSFGLAFVYAEWHAYNQAMADGFTDPFDQCVEIDRWEGVFDARVICECTR
ncbi:MAG: hypothetical protein HOV94_23445 [Saccharothrix sp.]|nr:hypothetical protein [Saccharothrix sp.]